jgi:hypothetical protein
MTSRAQTWVKVTGIETTRYQRITPIVRAVGLRPMEERAAYRRVPRLELRADGTVHQLDPKRGSDAGNGDGDRV